jgi:hypothetical protein
VDRRCARSRGRIGWGNGRHVVLVFFRPSGGGAFVAHTPTACRPHLFRRRQVVAVNAATAATHRWTGSARGRGVGSGGGTDGMSSSSSFSGAGVGARETRGVRLGRCMRGNRLRRAGERLGHGHGQCLVFNNSTVAFEESKTVECEK